MEQLNSMGSPHTSTQASKLFGSEVEEQQTDRLNTIIGYMRQEKQKETEIRMNAELELQRVKVQSSMDHQKIITLETELIRTRNSAEVHI